MWVCIQSLHLCFVIFELLTRSLSTGVQPTAGNSEALYVLTVTSQVVLKGKLGESIFTLITLSLQNNQLQDISPFASVS